jgi:hypothetical protein
MFYCTIYKQAKLSDKNTCEVFLSLSYLDKADAEKYRQTLIQQTIEAGGRTYITEGNYTTITGKVLLKPTGITSNRSSNHYRIGVESEAAKFSIIPVKQRSLIPAYKITDGLAYEIYVEDAAQRQLTELLAREEVVSENLKKFAEEIKPMTDIYPVLRSFVKYSNQKTDKEVLATIAISKIQELLV